MNSHLNIFFATGRSCVCSEYRERVIPPLSISRIGIVSVYPLLLQESFRLVHLSSFVNVYFCLPALQIFVDHAMRVLRSVLFSSPRSRTCSSSREPKDRKIERLDLTLVDIYDNVPRVSFGGRSDNDNDTGWFVGFVG